MTSAHARAQAESRGIEVALATSIASYDAIPGTYADRYYKIDMGRYLRMFVNMLPDSPEPVLDAGCGPGRDCLAFDRLEVPVIGVDRSSGLLAHASAATTAPLVLADLRDLPFRKAALAGVWACASLVHLDKVGIAAALKEFHRVLVPGGALFISVPHGSGEEWRSDKAGGRRWFHYHTEPELGTLLTSNGFHVSTAATELGVAAGTWVNVFGVRSRVPASHHGVTTV